MHKFDLPQEEAKKILREMIIPQILDGVFQTLNKQAYILGGQPGSGKSAFAREILKIEPNMVFINGDDLRAYHPKYYFYLKENDIEAADMTQAVCNFWIKELISECLRKNFNFIIEGTMRKLEGPMKTAKEAKKNEYTVNMVAISTPYELSSLSIDYRYQEVKKLEGFARFTKKESHDEAYKNMESTLRELVNSELFNKFFVYERFTGGFKENIFSIMEKEKMLNIFNEGRKRFVDEKEKELLKNLSSEIKIRK